jgi:hypothetical protein
MGTSAARKLGHPWGLNSQGGSGRGEQGLSTVGVLCVEQIQILKNQLAGLGETPIEEALSLREAELRLRHCMERLMAGEERAQVRPGRRLVVQLDLVFTP